MVLRCDVRNFGTMSAVVGDLVARHGRLDGLMTTAGGLGHTVPFLISHFGLAMMLATIVVALELLAISYIRHRYMDTPWTSATLQVVVGGVLVFLTGWLLGSA